jgi:hypothetical protein
VEWIGFWAFGECEALKEVIFEAPSCLKIIRGFPICPSLRRVEVPASVEKIGLAAFQDAASLRRLEIPASVQSIGFWAFARCTLLAEVTFATDSRLRVIRGFQGCVSLRRVEVPASVEEIAQAAFSGATSLRQVIFATGSRLTVMNGFQLCTRLRRLDIPASVERINSSEDAQGLPMDPLPDPPQRELILPSGTRVRPVSRKDSFRGFVVFKDDNDVKRRRRQVHQALLGFR